jgi:hypothetical protein
VIEATNQPPVLTFEAASAVGAYALSRRWADSTGEAERTADGELDQLATMAALAHWLTRWLPIQIHRAARAGASRTSIAAAMGVTVPEVMTRWTEWAQGQRDLYDLCHDDGKTPIGLTAEEFAQVAAVLGVTEQSTPSQQ